MLIDDAGLGNPSTLGGPIQKVVGQAEGHHVKALEGCRSRRSATAEPYEADAPAIRWVTSPDEVETRFLLKASRV